MGYIIRRNGRSHGEQLNRQAERPTMSEQGGSVLRNVPLRCENLSSGRKPAAHSLCKQILNLCDFFLAILDDATQVLGKVVGQAQSILFTIALELGNRDRERLQLTCNGAHVFDRIANLGCEPAGEDGEAYDSAEKAGRANHNGKLGPSGAGEGKGSPRSCEAPPRFFIEAS